uniref:Uncharacterized protein n=2 Tax=Onchocerca TaxID=6281 RepID=A0A8R1TNJ5_ONCVO
MRDSSKTTIGAEGISPSSPSTTSPAGDTVAYWEICKYLKEGGKETIDEQGVGAIMVKGNQWYGYDNEETIKIKMRWKVMVVPSYGLLISMTSKVRVVAYPLLSAINYELEGESTVSTKSSETTTATSENDEIKTTTNAVDPTRKPSLYLQIKKSHL